MGTQDLGPAAHLPGMPDCRAGSKSRSQAGKRHLPGITSSSTQHSCGQPSPALSCPPASPSLLAPAGALCSQVPSIGVSSSCSRMTGSSPHSDNLFVERELSRGASRAGDYRGLANGMQGDGPSFTPARKRESRWRIW
ncbi:hypothetical protein KIL84_021494 [Mauremys mutica]|uniref:Uncharacterized protein n=1 Tax=Mauremys mutica TaxID=74926 RepID=A0A9D4B000_9SAUR|nr:hypothetical protein KIL84_021494 [Mauremys mutica]